MSNDLMMRIKDQALIVLADYQSCKRQEIDEKLDLDFDRESGRVAIDISERMISNYMILSGRKKELPYITLAKARIEVMVLDAAKAKHDPWACCRDEGTRIRMAYDIARAIDEKAGKHHKFRVWSGSVIGLPGRGNEDVPCIVAAPSAKKVIEYLRLAIPNCRETLSRVQSHWTGGGNTGRKLANKLGVWVGKKKGSTDVVSGYELIWEPKL